MTPPPLPHASGVYQIRCIPTGKIYVGSAVNLRKRWEQHYRSLRKGEHRNHYLQHAWDKYGEEQFVFEILELVDVSHLLEAEQEWIDSTACVDKSVGFNIRDTAESSGRFNAQVWEGFIDPDGNGWCPSTDVMD
jgi:Straboviridae intron-associated endonuclease 1